jgi:ABC-2 type transport system ATP-binding protein
MPTGRRRGLPALAIEADGLVKVFGEQRAVDGVSLAVPQG